MITLIRSFEKGRHHYSFRDPSKLPLADLLPSSLSSRRCRTSCPAQMHDAGLKGMVFLNNRHDHPNVTIALFAMTGNPSFFFSFALLFFCLSHVADDSSRASSAWTTSRALVYSRLSTADKQATPRARDALARCAPPSDSRQQSLSAIRIPPPSLLNSFARCICLSSIAAKGCAR